MADADHSTKNCNICKKQLPISEFYGLKSSKDGLKAKCKECSKRQGKLLREKNPDYKKNYHLENREKILAQAAAYYAANREREYAKKKAHRLANSEYFAQYRAARRKQSAEYQRNRLEENRDLARKRRQKDPEKFRIYLNNRRAMKIQAGGRLSKGISVQLMSLQKSKCACCKVDLRKSGHHLDHIIPLVLGGSNRDSNIQLLCPKCNLSKGSKHPVEFMQSLGLLL